LDKVEAAKIFGRISSKYILLDSSGGSCCYSGCTDCEFRDPSGGYKMSSMSAARPKWVVCYPRRAFGTVEGLKSHASPLLESVFKGEEGPKGRVGREEFERRLGDMEYAQQLGGPYMSLGEGQEMGEGSGGKMFDSLAEGKEAIGWRDVEKILREWSGGEEGITWDKWWKGVGEE
ncbi:hypothetical protein TrRE_jg11621, partial [Triparma retinervis]